MSLQAANIALGKLHRGGRSLPREERVRLYARASLQLDAVDAETSVEDEAGRKKLAAAERRYRRVRLANGDAGLLP